MSMCVCWCWTMLNSIMCIYFVYLLAYITFDSHKHFLTNIVINTTLIHIHINILCDTGSGVELCVTALGELLNTNESCKDDSAISEKCGKIGKMRKNARTAVVD